MRVLVTGANGFLGRAVVAALAARGHTVVTFGRARSQQAAGSAARVSGDVRTPGSLHPSVAAVDAVCHLAALARVRDSAASPLQYWQTNTIGTLNLLEALSAASSPAQPKRLVLASTAAVYGNTEHQPINEDAAPAPSNPYGASKLAADLAAANLASTGAIGAISLRAFNIAGAANGLGDRDESRLIPKILAVQAGRADELIINGDGSAVRDFVHVIDMADAFALALDAAVPGRWRAYNVGSGLRTSVRDVVATAERVTSKPVPTRHRPPANEPPVLLADSSRICHELGWHAARSNLWQILNDGWNALTSTYSSAE